MKSEVTLDTVMLKRIAEEVASEAGYGCKVDRVAQLVNSTIWYITFTDGHAPLFNDFRTHVGGPYEEDLIRERIKNYLAAQHTGAKAGASQT
jgi:hypothetical protein